MGTFGLGGLHRKSTWLFPAATFGSLPATAIDGSAIIVRDTNTAYQFDAGLGWILMGGGGGAAGATSITLGYRGVIPTSTTFQALNVWGPSASSDVGFTPTAASTLIGMSITVNLAHPTNTYTLEAIEDPTGRQGTGPLVLGSLVLSPTARINERRDLAVAIGLGVEVGARVRRTGGSGNSNPIKSIIAVVEYRTP